MEKLQYYLHIISILRCHVIFSQNKFKKPIACTKKIYNEAHLKVEIKEAETNRCHLSPCKNNLTTKQNQLKVAVYKELA